MHTPGPWTVQESGKYVEGATCTVAKIYFLPELMDDAEAESYANARLIAAAPEMKSLLVEVTQQGGDGPLVDAILALLAQIEGQA